MSKPLRRHKSNEDTAAQRRLREELGRIDRQRRLWAALAPSSEKAALKTVMLERAWWLLDAGQAEDADAILEFLPEEDVQLPLTQFFDTTDEFDASLYGCG